MTTRAAIYCRISFDREGAGLGVARQEDDCRALAKRKGWDVIEPAYVDNDASAYTGKPRDDWNRLIEDVKNGHVDAVVAWHVDRLTRSPRELEDVIDLADANRLELATVTGDIDLATPTGRMVARILGSVARQESEHKGERQRRQIRQAAENGKRHRSRHRGYGYTRVFDDPDSPHRRVVAEDVDPDEAAVIRECAARLLSGESLISVVRDLNRRGITTAQGRQWQTVTLKSVLCSARISGRREMMRGGGSRYLGDIIAEGCWPAIVSVEDSDRLRAMLTNPARRTSPGNARRYMLSGILVCSRCERPMVARPRNDYSGSARYLCRSDPGHGGCGGTYVNQHGTDDHIRDQVITELAESPETVERLRRRDNPEPDLHGRIRADEDKLEELAADYGAEEITRAEWRAAREPIERRLSAARARLARTSHTSALDGFVGTRAEMYARWERMNVSQRRAVVTACVERIDVYPAKVAGHFDPDRLDPVWR